MHSRNFGSDKIVLTYVRPPLHVSRGETLHFKHPAFFCGKSHGHRDFKRETERKNNNNNKKAESFVRLNFNVYINVDNQERAKARNTQQRRPISLEEKHQNFTAAVRKWEMRGATKVKMCGNQKKWVGTHNISCITCIVVETIAKRCTKRCCTCKVVFFFYLCHCLYWFFSITRFSILFE